MKTRAVVCSGLGEPWKTEEVEIDPPANREVRVKMVYAGMCHSDEHLLHIRHAIHSATWGFWRPSGSDRPRGLPARHLVRRIPGEPGIPCPPGCLALPGGRY